MGNNSIYKWLSLFLGYLQPANRGGEKQLQLAC